MHTYINTAVTAALALAMSGVPTALVHAEDGASTEVTANAAVSARLFGERAEATTSVSARGSGQLQTVLEDRADKLASSTDEERGNATSTERRERNLVRFAERFSLDLSTTTTVALSADQLKQMIEKRREELNSEEASTTPEFKEVVKNANQVRLAVHALLASRQLLGGIGAQVSDIAKKMNESVATTTAAEAKIESRSVIARILFGGDKESAETLKAQVAQNAEEMAKLTNALAQANVSAEVKTTLEAQVTALKIEQDRLANLAASESAKWGLFSWLVNR